MKRKYALPKYGGGSNAGNGSGYLGELSIIRTPPVYPSPTPTFNVNLYSPTGNITGYSKQSPSDTPDVVSHGGLSQPFTLRNTTDDTTYTSLLWTVRQVETNTALPTGDRQTYTITPMPNNMSPPYLTWEITLSAFKNGVNGTSYLTIRDYATDNDFSLYNGSAIFRWITPNQDILFPITTLSKAYVTANDTWDFEVQHNASFDPDFLSITELHTNTGPPTFQTLSTTTDEWRFRWNFAIADFPTDTDFFIETVALYRTGPSPVTRYLRFKFNIPEPRDLVSSLTWDNIITTFATQQPPTNYISSRKTTTLTFINSTALTPSWDNSIITVTLS